MKHFDSSDTGRRHVAAPQRGAPVTALMILRRYLRTVRAGATAIASVAVAVITVGGAAFISDHAWFVDQRNVLKSASNAAGIAATLEMKRILARQPGISDSALQVELEQVARRYVELNLTHLSDDRFAQAIATLVMVVVPDRTLNTVDVSVSADLGGGVLTRHLPLFDGFERPSAVHAETKVVRITNPVEVVLAIDISQSMARCVDQQWGSRCRIADDSRMSVVKRAATDLVDVLDPNADDQVAFGVVPWHMVVRLDDIRSDEWARAGWAEYPRSRRYGVTYSCGGNRNRFMTCRAPAEDQVLPTTAPESWHGCMDEHRIPRGNSLASLPVSAAFTTPLAHDAFAQSFFPAPYGTSYNCLTAPAPSDYWFGFCYDAAGFTPMKGRGTQTQTLKSPQYGCDSTHPSILPLTSDRATIIGAIDRLDAVGKLTYSSLGVLWGQRLLEHDWKPVWGDPIHPVDATDNGARKALVLLTDGEDTYCDLGAGIKDSCETSTIGVDRTEACAAAKAAGTEVFVIAAMHPDHMSDKFVQALRDCSSESEEAEGTYVFVDNAAPADLEAAFADIATQLSIVRRVY